MLIPSISEYIQDGVHEMVWSSRAELHHIRTTAIAEMQQFMQANNCTDPRKAVRLMFSTESHYNIVEP